MKQGEKTEHDSGPGEKSARTADLFHLLGADCKKNIDLILEQTMAILKADFYLLLDRALPSSPCRSNLPAGLAKDLAAGFESRFQEPSDSFLGKLFYSNLSDQALNTLTTEDCLSPLAKGCQILAGIGIPIPSGQRGCLWIFYTRPKSFSPDEIFAFKALAAALDLEKKRMAREESKQKKLEGEKEKYRLLIENTQDAIYVVQDGCICFANPKTVELSGHTRKALFSLPFIQLIHPDDRERVQSNYEKRIKGEVFESSYTCRILNGKKQTFWVHLSVVRITWEGKPAVLGCLRDISQIRKLEKKLEQAEKMELIGVMAGGVAHDLNNILSGLVSYPELLLLQLPQDSPLAEPISFIHDTGLKAADIVQDLLTLTRRNTAQMSILNLNQVITEYMAGSAHQWAKKTYPEIRFKLLLEEDLLNIKGSGPHISKVVMNLVLNAAEAVGTRGEILIETSHDYLVPSGSTSFFQVHGGDTKLGDLEEGDYVVLGVKDNGDGISPSDLKRIFEPFYTKKQMGRSGSGLGLSVVWNTIKDHHGHIHVESSQDAGTVFKLFFPASRERRTQDSDNFQIADFKGQNQTVLVIDDVPAQRKIARECLETLGYSPITADSGEKAVNLLQTRPVDLLILDMRMYPGMDGLETYRAIVSRHPRQKAIIASGFSETDRVRAAQEIGAGQYLKKPYTLKKLALALKKELGVK